MYLIEVTPITRLPRNQPQTLSYFNLENLKKYSLVLIDFRKQKLPAIIINSKNISEEKIYLKKAGFKLKKIDKILTINPILTDWHFEYLQKLSDYYLTPITFTFKNTFSFLNSKIKFFEVNFYDFIKNNKFDKDENNKETIANKKEKPILFIEQNNKRIKYYCQEIKKIIRQEKQAMILMPDIALIEDLKLNLEKKLKEEITVIHSKMSNKIIFEKWLKIVNGETKIILGVKSAALIPPPNLGLIIIDREEDDNYKSESAPRYHAKNAALMINEMTNCRLILGTDLPSLESYYQIQNKNYQLKGKMPAKTKNIKIIDLKKELIWGTGNTIVSTELKNNLKKIISLKKQVIIFDLRRGGAIFNFCLDCGFIHKCVNCDVPLVAHAQNLICHYCGYQTKMPDLCPSCGGLKLKFSGSGTQKLETTINKEFPNLKILRFDSDSVKNEKQRDFMVKNFKNKNCDILIISPAFFKKKTITSDLTAIASIDTLLNLPDYRSPEKIFFIIKKLLNLRKKTSQYPLVIQTWQSDNQIFNFIDNMDYESFAKTELKNRSNFNYSPFKSIIKLTIKNINQKQAELSAKILAQKLKKDMPELNILGPTPAFIKKIKNLYIYQILIKINYDDTKNKQKLNEIISNEWIIDVDPISGI